MATGTGIVEVRDLDDLHLQRKLNLPVKGITSTALEALVPHRHFIAPKPVLAWDKVEKLGGKYEVRVQGVYRVRGMSRATVEVYAVCKPQVDHKNRMEVCHERDRQVGGPGI